MKDQTSLGVSPVQEGPGHRIALYLRDLEQFFNTMDPSPFHEKDLDDNVEGFIVNWAKEYPLDEPVRLVVHLQNAPELGTDSRDVIERAVHHYFEYRPPSAAVNFASSFARDESVCSSA